MKSFTVTFITFDGNKMQSIVDAQNEQRAEIIFDANYQYAEIISIKED